MHIYKNLDEWRRIRQAFPPDRSTGLVTTMGNLHIGHASLFNISKQENDCTIASIFINPTQFNNTADLTNYPRTLDNDLELLSQSGVDYCLLPDEKTMYADGYRFQVDENSYSNQMEGACRPGHFKGVLTVVMKLLNLAKPTRAYFGEKDAMQLQLIRDMAQAFFMDVEIKSCPTVRENSQLPYSSRNNRLNPEERKLADQFAEIFHQKLSCQQIMDELTNVGIQVEYIEEHDNKRFIAVKIGAIRLIDNYPIG